MTRKKQKLTKEQQNERAEYLRQWRKRNPDYYKKYYKTHKKQMQDSTYRYRNSARGKATIKAYEQTPERMAIKRAYQKSLREAKKTLEKLKKRGKI